MAARGDRVISYGVNMYVTARALKTETPVTRPVLVTEKCTVIPPHDNTAVPSAVQPEEGAQAVSKELNALARLIGVESGVCEADTFKLTLFDDFNDEGMRPDTSVVDIRSDFDIRIEPKKKDESHLNQIMRDFTLPDVSSDTCQDSEDILQLMDAIL